MFWSVYLSAGLIFVLALAARALEGRWLAPGSFFCTVWAVATVPACFIIPEVIESTAILAIAAFMIITILGSLVGRSWAVQLPASHQDRVEKRAKKETSGLAWVVALLGSAGFAAAYSYIQNAGWQLRDLSQAATWLNMAATYSAERYSGISSETLGVRFLLALNYTGALLGGVLIAAYKPRALKVLGFVPLLAAVSITIITTAKTPFLVVTLMLVSAYIVIGRRAERPAVVTRGWHRTLAAALLVAGILSASLFSLSLRYGDASDKDPDLVSSRFQSYIFGYMAAWSAWATTENIFAAPTTGGKLTFAGAFEALNLGTREPGLNPPIAINDVAAESNVFTALRGLIADISFPAALLATFVCAALAGLCFRRLSQTVRFTLPAIYLMAYFTFVGWSPVVSIFIYNSILFAFILAGVLLFLFSREIEYQMGYSIADRA
jgi:oligosaccharide repeat unit polymerase